MKAAEKLPTVIQSKQVLTGAVKLVQSEQFKNFIAKWENGENLRECISVFTQKETMTMIFQYSAELVTLVATTHKYKGAADNPRLTK